MTIWAAEEFTPAQEVLSLQLEDFEATSLNVRVAIQLKSMEGKSGLVNLLATSALVAPSVLPDVAIVTTAQAEKLAQLGLIRPWNNLLPPTFDEDLFPLSQRLGHYEGQRMGISVALDVQHVAYDVDRALTPPSSWQNILAGTEFYLFPAMGKEDAIDTLLVQYVLSGGQLSDGRSALPLEREPLTATLAVYQGLAISGVLPPEALQLDSLAACWPLYLSGRVGMVHVWSSRYLAEGSKIQSTSFAPIPSADESTATIGRGWLMVLVTEDPGRQERAARLLSWWMSPQQNAAMCRATGWLPPGRKAFAAWRDDSRYHPFIEEHLEVALPRPALPPAWTEALSESIDQVLRGQATAQQAAAQVMSVVSP